jgi:hypothetical protein
MKKIPNYFYLLITISLLINFQIIQPISIRKANSQYQQVDENKVKADTIYGCYDLQIIDDKLYYVDYYGLEIHDISDPKDLTYLDYVYLEHMGNQAKVIVYDNIAYISDEVSNINLINCHDPSNAAKFSSFIVGDYFDEIVTFDVEGDFIYVIVEGILKVFNLTVLSSPTLVTTYGNSSYMFNDMHIENEKLYLLNPTIGFDILDISNTSNLTLLGYWHTTGNYLSIYKEINHLYLLEENKDMNIFSVSLPSNPFILDTFQIELPSQFKDFIIKNNRLFVLNNIGFEFYDVSSLYNEQHLGDFQREDRGLDFTAIDVSGNHVFMTSKFTSYGEDLYLIDITNPDEPILLLPVDRPWYWGSLILSIVMSLAYYVIPGVIIALIVFFVIRYFRRRDMKEFKDIEKVAIKKEKKKYWEKEH